MAKRPQEEVSPNTIRDFEAGRRIPHANNLTAMREAFEAAGLRFKNADDGSPLAVAPNGRGKPGK
jgi:hypothetical protein